MRPRALSRVFKNYIQLRRQLRAHICFVGVRLLHVTLSLLCFQSRFLRIRLCRRKCGCRSSLTGFHIRFRLRRLRLRIGSFAPRFSRVGLSFGLGRLCGSGIGLSVRCCGLCGSGNGFGLGLGRLCICFCGLGFIFQPIRSIRLSLGLGLRFCCGCALVIGSLLGYFFDCDRTCIFGGLHRFARDCD